MRVLRVIGAVAPLRVLRRSITGKSWPRTLARPRIHPRAPRHPGQAFEGEGHHLAGLLAPGDQKAFRSEPEGDAPPLAPGAAIAAARGDAATALELAPRKLEGPVAQVRGLRRVRHRIAQAGKRRLSFCDRLVRGDTGFTM